MVEILYGLEGIQKGIADYHSTPQKNFYMAGPGGVDVYFNCDYLAIPPVGQEYNFPPNWWWMTKTLPDGRIGWIFMQAGARQYRFKAQPGATIETASFYWESSAAYNIANPPWWPAFGPFYNAGTFSVIPETPWLHKHNYNSVDITPFVNLWLSCVSADLATRALPYWSTAQWGEPWTTYEVVADIEIFYRSESHLDGYYFNFPSYAPVPDWYHFATLIKAEGTKLGKEIAVTREAPGLPFNMEIWRKEPDPSEIYDYFPKQFLMDSNLLDELEFPLEPSAELAAIGGGEVTPVYFYPWLTEPPTDQQFTPAQLQALTTFPAIDPATGEPHPQAGELIFDPDTDIQGHIMPDSKRLIEIHTALKADTYAYGDPIPGNPDLPPRVANLGYYIERLARVLGISVNPDGSIRSVRQRRVLPATGTIAAGWGLGQWELNEGGTFLGQVGGNTGEERDGYAYVQRSNVIKKSVFSEDDFEVDKGNIVLCENLMQLFESYLEDLDKGLNWQEMGGAVLPNADTTPNADGSQKFCSIEGMGTLLAEVAYMLSAMSKNTSQTFISSLVTQAITQEILQALGTPLEIKYVPAEAGDLDAEGYRTKIPFPGVADDAPTVLQQALWILENLAQLKGALAKPSDLPTPPSP